MALLDAIAEVAEHALDYVFWRREWDRKANPVAFWIATVSAAVALLTVGLWLYAGWEGR